MHEKETAFDLTLAAMKDPAPSLATVAPHVGPVLVTAVDRALAFDKANRWQSARAMFEALRGAYEELHQQACAPTSRSADLPVTFEEGPSLVVDVTFGAEHDDAVARERARTREVIESLSSISVVVPSDPATRR